MKSLTKAEKVLLDLLGSGHGLHCPYKNVCLSKGRTCGDQSRQDSDGSYQCLISVASCQLRRAIELLADLYLGKGEVNEPPVPAELIAFADAERSIQVQSLPLKAHHGCLWFFGDEWLVQLNARDSKEEQRYTMYHEAFHILCYNVSPSFKRSDQAKPMRRPFYELLADCFATYVLMPSRWVSERWFQSRRVDEMARIFGVPICSMERRLAELCLRNGSSVSEAQTGHS